MMPSDFELAQACADIYPQAGEGFNAAQGRFAQYWTRENIHVGLRHAETHDIFCFRGSIDEIDWLRDFEGWPSKHPQLGYCHSGFLRGMGVVSEELAMAITPDRPYAITGHSLGAARALILAGLWTAQGRPPALVVTFGTPRPGMAKLSNILNTGGFFIKHYKNGPDPVADVQPTLPPLALWQKPVVDTPLNVVPTDGAADPFHWHHMPLYLEGMKPPGS